MNLERKAADLSIIEFIQISNEFKRQHDIICNQKYGPVEFNIPYSFHLKMVENQYRKFHHLLNINERMLVLAACHGHDLIEDARMTYNDIINISCVEIAEIIYCCTESTGRNRKERHDEEFYKRLTSNELAIFVKTCDIIANVKFSLLENSRMFDKYKKEFPFYKGIIMSTTHRFNEMLVYLEKLLEL